MRSETHPWMTRLPSNAWLRRRGMHNVAILYRYDHALSCNKASQFTTCNTCIFFVQKNPLPPPKSVPMLVPSKNSYHAAIPIVSIYSVRLQWVPGGPSNPSESSQAKVHYGIGPTTYPTQKHSPPPTKNVPMLALS